MKALNLRSIENHHNLGSAHLNEQAQEQVLIQNSGAEPVTFRYAEDGVVKYARALRPNMAGGLPVNKDLARGVFDTVQVVIEGEVVGEVVYDSDISRVVFDHTQHLKAYYR